MLYVCVCCTVDVCRHFPEVLRALFTLVTMETDPRCLDNICAAVCRMVMAQPDAVPLDQVIIVIRCVKPLLEICILGYTCITNKSAC